ncbi:hypothetical protein CEP54_010855 [Fusarium duplospermum]|uniref:Uncharacterized protein n=1 Tax=Fusarium duplospermum TaxID=1325734 RepID=A0A428PHM9_9HYPO|nr:hypothetical protein CEP54_010855 [Fusarium duplospermum]
MGPNLGASIDGPSEDALRGQPIFSTQKDGLEAMMKAMLSDNAAAATVSREQADDLDQAAAGYQFSMSKGSVARKDGSSKSDSDSARTIESDDPVFAQPAADDLGFAQIVSEAGYQSEMSQQSSQFSIERNSTGEALESIERHLNDLIEVLSEGYIAWGIRKMGTALLFPFRSNDTQRRAGRKEFKRVITGMEAPIRELKERLEKLENDNAIPGQHRKELINLYTRIHTELSTNAVEEWVAYRGVRSWQDTSLYRRAQALEMRIKLWEATATEALERPTQTDGQDSNS